MKWGWDCSSCIASFRNRILTLCFEIFWGFYSRGKIGAIFPVLIAQKMKLTTLTFASLIDGFRQTFILVKNIDITTIFKGKKSQKSLIEIGQCWFFWVTQIKIIRECSTVQVKTTFISLILV